MSNNPRFLVLLLAAACGGTTAPTTSPDATDSEPEADAHVEPSIPPVIALSSAGYLVDPAMWWTDSATPVLTGTINAASMSAIKATIRGVDHAGAIVGDTFTIAVPANSLDGAGSDVVITATNGAGETATASQRIGADLTPPVMAVLGSSVRDEAQDTITFPQNNGVPSHVHGGAAVDLASPTTCPTVSKYSYFLDAASTLETTPNPIAYNVAVTEDGVGLVTAIEYRVGRRAAGATVWLQDWADAGAPTQSGQDLELSRLLHRDAATTIFDGSATYDVEFRSADRFGRVATLSRCIDLQLLLPPVWFGAFSGRNIGSIAANHPLAMQTLKLEPGAVHDRLSERLLRGKNSTGASVYDMLVTNGTPDSAVLTVDLVAPSTASASKRFVVRGHRSSVTAVSNLCSQTNQGPCMPPNYKRATAEQTTSSPTEPIATRIAVFVHDGTDATELPVFALPSENRYQFVLPPYSAAAPKTYVIMTLVNAVNELQPINQTYPDPGPFSDTTIDGLRISGRTYTSVTGCTDVQYVDGEATRCLERSMVIPYRALTYALLQMTSATRMTYSISGSVSQVPTVITSNVAPVGTYLSTTEGTLPSYNAPASPF